MKPDSCSIRSLFEPEIESGIHQLRNLLPQQAYPGMLTEQSFVRIVLPNLLSRLEHISDRTIWAHYMLSEQELTGDSRQEKLLSYFNLMSDPEIQAYFRSNFPVLFDLAKSETCQWVKLSYQLINHYLTDFKWLCCAGLIDDSTETIDSIEYGLGDKHADGSSVSLITFKSGKKILYIPVSRTIYQPLKALCDWLNDSLDMGLKLPVMLVKDGHTWAEYIPHTSCNETSQINRFYQRMGGWLALLYILDATDFHFENIIAFNEYPVLIDLETFFHPFMPEEMYDHDLGFRNSVTKTGILPTIYASNHYDKADFSGLGNPEGALEAVENLYFSLNEKGHLSVNRQKEKLNGAQNMPLLNGQPVPLASCSLKEELKQGFSRVYTFLYQNKVDLIEKLEPFKQLTVRVLLRNTATYVHLLQESLHPAILQNRACLNEHLNWLNYARKEHPIIQHFIASEWADLSVQCIPYFYTKANSTDLFHHGLMIKPSFFEQSGFQNVLEKIEQLSKDDLEKQHWLIDECLSCQEVNVVPSTIKKQLLNTLPSF
jgi:type 2 lantibiotic biosynthesis protein LanM